jgi:hypothetical protein
LRREVGHIVGDVRPNRLEPQSCEPRKPDRCR